MVIKKQVTSKFQEDLNSKSCREQEGLDAYFPGFSLTSQNYQTLIGTMCTQPWWGLTTGVSKNRTSQRASSKTLHGTRLCSDCDQY